MSKCPILTVSCLQQDVLIALGVLDNSAREIGLEGCGVVTGVGSGVSRVAVGDRVMYMSSGCFTSEMTLSEKLCVKISDSITFEQGAGLPCVYATATMALADKANIQPGQVSIMSRFTLDANANYRQSILIHSACGGVGLAAIQIAQMLGAEVSTRPLSESSDSYLS
jgi:NADPH:quinone reductase-like Zn-dependent oxidoreductase